MTLETINNLKILAEEVMITALADYDYYTKNGEVVPAIDIFDTITNVWIKDKSHSAGRHITAEEVLSARVNPTGAVLSDYVNSLARDFVISYKDRVSKEEVTNQDASNHKLVSLQIVKEGTDYIVSKFEELENDIANIANDTKRYRFLLRPEPEYLKELFMYFVKNNCAISIDTFLNLRLNTDLLIDRPYLTSKHVSRDDLKNISTIVYWSKYEYGYEDYNIGKWLAILLSKITNAIRKEDLEKEGKLTVEENIKTIPIVEFNTPYVGKVWEYEELLDKLGATENIFTLDNVTNTQIGKQEIFQYLEIQAMKFKTPYTCIENSSIPMFVMKISSLFKYLDDEDIMMLRTNMERYKRAHRGDYANYRESVIRTVAGNTIDEYRPGIAVPNFEVPPLDKSETIVAKLPSVEEIIAKYEEAKLNEGVVSNTFLATNEKYPYSSETIVHEDPEIIIIPEEGEDEDTMDNDNEGAGNSGDTNNNNPSDTDGGNNKPTVPDSSVGDNVDDKRDDGDVEVPDQREDIENPEDKEGELIDGDQTDTDDRGDTTDQDTPGGRDESDGSSSGEQNIPGVDEGSTGEDGTLPPDSEGGEGSEDKGDECEPISITYSPVMSKYDRPKYSPDNKPKIPSVIRVDD